MSTWRGLPKTRFIRCSTNYIRTAPLSRRPWSRERAAFNLDATIYLYDLTSTYFEGLAAKNGKANRGYSRDHRPDCKQVVVGLVVNRDGFPITHEIFAGNGSRIAPALRSCSTAWVSALASNREPPWFSTAAWPMTTTLPSSKRASSTTLSPVGNPSATAGSPISRIPMALRRCGASLHERALEIYENVVGPEHLLTVASLNYLARIIQEEGDLAAAQPFYERALAIREKVLGLEHLDTAESLENLATLIHHQGDLGAARPLVERALAIYEKVLGSEHILTAGSLNHLACLLEKQGDLAAARPLYERTLAISENLFGSEHPLPPLPPTTMCPAQTFGLGRKMSSGSLPMRSTRLAA